MPRLPHSIPLNYKSLTLSDFRLVDRGRLMFDPKMAGAATFTGDIGSIWSLAGTQLVRDESPFGELRERVGEHVEEGAAIADELRGEMEQIQQMQEAVDTLFASK